MRIKIHSAEMNRMMKTLSKCIDPKLQQYGNIQVIYDNNLLTLRGTNGQFSAVMSTPVMGGDGEGFCVDGETFGKVCALCKGEMEIITEGRVCTIKGAGRTRLPIVDARIPAFAGVEDGQSTVIKAEAFIKAFGGVEHAISDDQGQARIALTGVNVEIGEYGMKMIGLDGFVMAVETAQCSGDIFKMVVPGTFMRLIKDSVVAGEEIKIRSDGTRIQVSTEGMMISCPLLMADFPDYKRILPTEFKTETLVNADLLKTALKNATVVCNTGKLVKFVLDGDVMTVSGNSERADYEAEIPCQTHGENLTIAFNQRYMVETIGSIGTEDVVMQFNSPISPCVVHGKSDEPGEGIRLVLPVRVQG